MRMRRKAAAAEAGGCGLAMHAGCADPKAANDSAANTCTVISIVRPPIPDPLCDRRIEQRTP